MAEAEALATWVGETSHRPTSKQVREQSSLVSCLLLCLEAAGAQEPGQPIAIKKHGDEESSQREEVGSGRKDWILDDVKHL